MKKDCGCDKKKKAPKHVWLDKSDDIDKFVEQVFSPAKENDIFAMISKNKSNFINSKSLVNKELKENKEKFITITSDEFSLKFESLML